MPEIPLVGLLQSYKVADTADGAHLTEAPYSLRVATYFHRKRLNPKTL